MISIKEIWSTFQEKTPNTLTRQQFEVGVNTNTYKFFHYLKSYGLDLTNYDTLMNTTPNDADAEIAYQRFILGGQNASLQSDLVRKKFSQQVQHTFTPDADTNARHKLPENYQDNYQDKKAA